VALDEIDVPAAERREGIDAALPTAIDDAAHPGRELIEHRVVHRALFASRILLLHGDGASTKEGDPPTAPLIQHLATEWRAAREGCPNSPLDRGQSRSTIR
jgi:hypothetical protein